MNHILSERMKELIEDVDWEKALKEVFNATTKEKSKAVEVTKEKAQFSKKAQLVAEGK